MLPPGCPPLLRRHPHHPGAHRRGVTHALAATALALLAAGCAGVPDEVPGPLRKDHLLIATAANELLRVNAGQPQRVLQRVAIKGLSADETLVGIDFRIARGQLYGLGSTGRLYRLDPADGQATALSPAPTVTVTGTTIGFDFNPTVDRIRVVTPAAGNLRLHPDTGAQVDGDAQAPGVQPDGALVFAPGDVNAGKAPRIVAAGYSYNKRDEKITSNYAIDAASGTLVLQGSLEGRQPVVSPNTGRLTTVGPLGLGRFGDAHFDIADVSGDAYLVADTGRGWQLHQVDLASGRATTVGTIGSREAIRGIAIEP